MTHGENQFVLSNSKNKNILMFHEKHIFPIWWNTGILYVYRGYSCITSTEFPQACMIPDADTKRILIQDGMAFVMVDGK